MQRFEPILKSWLIWLILAASAAGFAVLVLTDDAPAHKSPPNDPAAAAPADGS